MSFDERVPTDETYNGKWEQQIVVKFLADKEVGNQEIEENEENGSFEIVDPSDGSELTYEEVLSMLTKLQNFALDKDSRYLAAVQNFKLITERHIVQNQRSLKQTSLDAFFKRT